MGKSVFTQPLGDSNSKEMGDHIGVAITKHLNYDYFVLLQPT